MLRRLILVLAVALSTAGLGVATAAATTGVVAYDYDEIPQFTPVPETMSADEAHDPGPVGRAPAAAFGVHPEISADRVAPRTPLSLGRFADDTFYDVIPTRAGDLEVLAEVSVSGRTLTLSDIAVYGADGDLVNEVGGPALVGIRKALATEAADAGFDTLRLTGVRVPTSSSANPGHVIDRVIDLERFRR